MARRRNERLAPVLLVALAGCAGYQGDLETVRKALLAGDKRTALAEIDRALDVKEPEELPDDVSGDNALLVLERGTIEQGLGEFDSASRDFRVADKHLELLDLKNDTMGKIGKWMFSDDVTAYKAPPHEKLLLNALGMINYLAAGDLEGARVEARRFRIVRDYLRDAETPEAARLKLGSYLAGFSWEMSGRHEQALRSYGEVLSLGGEHPSLEAPVRRLAACSGQRPAGVERLLADEEQIPEGCDVPPSERGTLLVVSGIGLAPHKVARRIPIGAALVVAGSATYGPGLGASNRRRANELAAKGLLKFVNFPELRKSRPRFRRVRVSVGGRRIGTELGQNVTARVVEAWNRIKGTLMAAAIVRMITRAVAGEAANRAAKSGGAAGGLALLAGLAVEGALTAADTPDTRSWVTLPSHVVLSRCEVEPGRHEVVVELSGAAGRERHTRLVDVPGGGFSVVAISAMR